MKKTPWFDGSIKPVREGVYQRMLGRDFYWSRFENGEWYACWALSKFSEAARTRVVSPLQKRSWRGLTKEFK